mmetsp:Transcript_18317/g.29196  ORF Transcript_18317/g.29196 Transcript_18317/m.29196 type:complete len:105 (+) Transcript_18317:957-1271(+)
MPPGPNRLCLGLDVLGVDVPLLRQLPVGVACALVERGVLVRLAALLRCGPRGLNASPSLRFRIFFLIPIDEDAKDEPFTNFLLPFISAGLLKATVSGVFAGVLG